MSWKALVGLCVAVLAVSFGAPLARLTDAAPLAVAMWRMSLAAGLLLPVAIGGGTLKIPGQHRPARCWPGSSSDFTSASGSRRCG